MQKTRDAVLYSASDLVNFLDCEHLTSLDLINLVTPLPRTEDTDEAKLIQDKGHKHEARFVASLKSRHTSFIDVAARGGNLDDKVAATLQAMRDGVEIVYQATLRDCLLFGHADFLRRVPRPSSLGDYSYEVVDTKLARTTKAKFIIQLGFYSALLEKAQGVTPLAMHVVLGDQSEDTYRCAEYAKYLALLTQRFLARVADSEVQTYPDPCTKCDQCRWRGICEERRIVDDHLCQVADIRKIQIKRLEAAGVGTLAALSGLPPGTKIPKMAVETLEKLRRQAALQYKGRETGTNHLDLLPEEVGGGRGFSRLPRPDAADLFFDMEGDPLEEGGLEYLFGLYHLQNGKPAFKAFWAHDRAEERIAFEQFMDYVTGWLKVNPGAHIYHYAHYEQTALKKLMSLHGTREAEVDNLLRAGKMIDLYKVVREGIRVSEPSYSLKHIEHFYSEKRTGDVKSAGASIVYFERWRETGDPQFLRDIEAYNHDDVRSTYQLHRWLLSLRPPGMPWAKGSLPATAAAPPQVGDLTDAERRLIPYRERLVDSLPVDRETWGKAELMRELTFQLLDFHRRAAKPEWWAMFARAEMTEDELLEDVECLAGLTPDPDNAPEQVKRSIRYSFAFPEQETKLKTGDGATIAQTSEAIRDLQVDEEGRRVSFIRATGKDPLPTPLSLGPGMPVSTKALVNAVFRFADSVIEDTREFSAIESLLRQEPPRIQGRARGVPIIPIVKDPMPHIIDAISKLDHSYIFVQGPPGAGKTYTGSHVIVALLKQGYTVGISSNSHKAINNMLRGVVKVAKDQDYVFRGAKKSTNGKPDSCFDGAYVEDVFENDNIWGDIGGPAGYRLVAGTAWLFAAADQMLDFIFVDEAGQVALANLVAMGTSARNIVLLGDQMQLGQPIQGIHPGRSGESSLDYLLNGMATIPPDRGVFLATTWRMHPDVCRFISDAVYDGRLEPESNNARQSLLLGPDAHPSLKPTGIRYLPIEHDGNSQRSDEEANLVRELVESLLKQRFRDKGGIDHPVTLDDILVVAPFNLQVNRLRAVLQDGARVGTVDKFQGQEAAVVVVSMATSSGDHLPRNIEFLYSKNRLNVAISRAKCLAVFIANPALMSIRCSRPEEMVLVNTLCRVRDVG